MGDIWEGRLDSLRWEPGGEAHLFIFFREMAKSFSHFLDFLKKIIIIYFFCVCGCPGSLLLLTSFLPSCGEWGLLFVEVLGLLIAAAPLPLSTGAGQAGFSSCGPKAPWLQTPEPRFCSCDPGARGIFLDQGLNPWPLRWQVDYYPVTPGESQLGYFEL